MTTKREINVRLLRRIQKHILAEPRRFNMGDWIANGRPEADYHKVGQDFVPFPACGTAACIGGWAVLLSGLHKGDRAAKLLGIAPPAFSGFRGITQGDRLFLVCNWPEKFILRYRAARTQSQRAKVAARRIDHFIQTGGAE